MIPTVGDAWLATVAEKLPCLRSLSLRQCTRVTNVGLMSFVKRKHAALTMLDLRDCQRVTVAAVQSLAGACNQLTTVRVRGCRNFHAFSFSAKASALPPALIDVTESPAWYESYEYAHFPH